MTEYQKAMLDRYADAAQSLRELADSIDGVSGYEPRAELVALDFYRIADKLGRLADKCRGIANVYGGELTR